MPSYVIGLICILLLVGLIYSGLHIAIAMIITSFIGVYLIKGNIFVAGRLLAIASFDSLAIYNLAVIPLFILMGMLVSAGGLGEDAFSACRYIFRRIPGGVGIATVAANTIFAAITGVSLVSAAVFAKVAVPEMLRLGYGNRFAVGSVAGSSVLGMLIPPSILLIFYAMMAEVSIGRMFIAGIVPGLVLAFCFSIGILVAAYFLPRFVFQRSQGAANEIGAEEEKVGRRAILKLIPMLILVTVMLGGLYGGFFTPAEAGAVGALGALILVLARRRLGLEDFFRALSDTCHLTASLGILIVAASIFSHTLTLSRLPMILVNFIAENQLSLIGVVVSVIFLEILLGMIMDALSNMLIALPIIIPVVKALEGDLIWFGIVTVIASEIGLLTPPVGLSPFVIKSTIMDDRISLGDVFAGSFPFLLIMVLVLFLLIVFPGLVYA